MLFDYKLPIGSFFCLCARYIMRFNTWYADDEMNYCFCTDVPNGQNDRYLGWYLSSMSHQVVFDHMMPPPYDWNEPDQYTGEDPFIELDDQCYMIRTLFGEI